MSISSTREFLVKFRFAIAIAIASALLGGCASPPQNPVTLRTDTLNAQAGRVGIAMSALPKVNTFFPGAGCLLCLATAEMANSSLSTHTKTLTHEDLPTLKEQAADILRKKGVDVVVISDPLDVSDLSSSSAQGVNVAKKDFSALASKYQIEHLIVYQINTVGFVRTYSSYIPTEDPKATVEGTAFMVNLRSNVYEWYSPVNTRRASAGAWSESPNFPGLTNAYYQVLEESKDKFLNPLKVSAAVAGTP